MKMRVFTVLMVFLRIITLNVQSSNISINARFEPNEVEINREVRYILDILNGFPEDLEIPNVDGLIQRGRRVYQSSSTINGVSSQKITLIYSFIPIKTGILEIPEYGIEINGEAYTVMSSKVKVTDDPTAATYSQNEQKEEQGMTLEISVKNSQAYVGQNIPITISVKLNNKVQLIAPIKTKILGDSFFQSPLSKQPQSKVEKKYEIYSWNAFLTPLKSGKQKISFQASCPIQIVRSMGFFSFAEEENQSLTSNSIPIEIKSLPEAPSHFRGGIGKFTLTNLRLSSDRALQGEPIALSVDIVGEGNFTQLNPSEIENNESWKTFSPRVLNFISQDDFDFKGIKTIEYVIEPQKTGEIVIPNITLTYFNPETESFETSTIDNSTKTVLISRSAETFSNYDSKIEIENKDNENKSKGAITEAHVFSKDTRQYTTLKPIFSYSWFWILQVILASAALLFIIKTRKPSVKKKMPKWDLKKIKKLLSETVDSGNIRQFYKTAMEAIDQKLAMEGISREKHRSEQMKQLQLRGIKHLKWLETFWDEADAISFGQSQFDKNHINHQLEKLLMFLQQWS